MINQHDKTIKDLVGLIHDISIIRSGFALENTQTFANRMYRIVELGLGLDEEETDDIVDEEIEEVVEDSKMEEVD